MLGIGSVVDGRYEVEGLIGEGGMGVVMRAHHRFTGAVVALKMLHPHLRMRSDLAARFLVEARAPAAIGHPGIVTVLDGGVTAEGDPYFAMELLNGEPLHQLMSRQQLPFETVRQICLQVLDALGAAHAAGFIHRDLKPENVFVQSPSGTIKLLDFGITKSLSEVGEGSTRTGATMGTLLYMSPEQLRNAKRVDQRTDLWAVGVMLRQMLAGELPYRAESLGDMLVLVLSHPPRPLSFDLAQVPPELEALMARALAADPGQRFGSAQEMAHAIAALPSLSLRLITGAPGWVSPPAEVPPTMTAAPSAVLSHTAEPALDVKGSRKPIWLTLLAGVSLLGVVAVVLVLLGVGGWWVFARQVDSVSPGCERACAALRGCGLQTPQDECVTGCQSQPAQAKCFAAAGTDCNAVGACHVEAICQAKPQGTASCAQTRVCEASCEMKDMACACRCLRAAAPSAAASIAIAGSCVLRYCESECAGEKASRADCNQCAARRCARELEACTGSAPSKDTAQSEKPSEEAPPLDKPKLAPKHQPLKPVPAPEPKAPAEEPAGGMP